MKNFALGCLCQALALAAVLVVVPTDAKKPDVERSSHWPAVRAAHLKRFPTCAACGAKDTLEVHHVKPFHLFPELELQDDNLITLCEKPGHSCHFVFGHNYNWKCWNPEVREDAARQFARVKARKES